MPVWIINKPGKKRGAGRKVARKRVRRRKASKRKPSAAQLRARKRFAAMARARARAARKSKTTRKSGGKSMARRARRASSRKRRRTSGGVMKSVRRKGGASVSRSAWKASGWRRNPRRRVRRRYRRNPSVAGIGRQVIEMGKQTVAVLAGRTLGRTLSGMIPFGGTSPLVSAGKGVAVAIGIKMLARRVVSADLADALAVGALIGPVTDLVNSYTPSLAPYLSGGPIGMPTFPAMGTYAPRVGSYPRLAGNPDASDDGIYVGSYSQDPYQQ